MGLFTVGAENYMTPIGGRIGSALTKSKNLPLIRRLAFSDIDEALMKILYDTLVYLNSTGLVVDPMTQKTYDYYKQIFEEKTIYD